MEDRSPIREIPLRAPAQSLEEHRIDVLLDRLLMPVVMAIFLIALWLEDLWRAYRNLPPMPWVSGSLAVIGVGYAAWKIAKALPHIRNLRLAIQGERSVGQGLEELRRAGYGVYHDIPDDHANIDHVLVGPAGIFTIETKTRSKPRKGHATVIVDGETISINGRDAGPELIAQARAQAGSIAKTLKQGAGREFPVFPVIVFPGWWVEIKARPSGLWVINDKALPGFLARERARLNVEEVSTAKSQLEMFIRAKIRYA